MSGNLVGGARPQTDSVPSIAAPQGRVEIDGTGRHVRHKSGAQLPAAMNGLGRVPRRYRLYPAARLDAILHCRACAATLGHAASRRHCWFHRCRVPPVDVPPTIACAPRRCAPRDFACAPTGARIAATGTIRRVYRHRVAKRLRAQRRQDHAESQAVLRVVAMLMRCRTATQFDVT